MYVVPFFNIANVSCLLFMVDRPFQEYTSFVEPILSRTLRNRSSLVNHLTFRKQNLAFASAPPMAALTKLFLSIPVCVMEKMSQNTNFLLREQYLIKGFVIRPNNESNIFSRPCFVRARTTKSINPHLNPTVKMLYYARMRQK